MPADIFGECQQLPADIEQGRRVNGARRAEEFLLGECPFGQAGQHCGIDDGPTRRKLHIAFESVEQFLTAQSAGGRHRREPAMRHGIELGVRMEIDADAGRAVARPLRPHLHNLTALADDPFADEPADGEGFVVAGGAEGGREPGALAIREGAVAHVDRQRFFGGELDEARFRSSIHDLPDCVFRGSGFGVSRRRGHRRLS